jgi:hypothetical protein
MSMLSGQKGAQSLEEGMGPTTSSCVDEDNPFSLSADDLANMNEV